MKQFLQDSQKQQQEAQKEINDLHKQLINTEVKHCIGVSTEKNIDNQKDQELTNQLAILQHVLQEKDHQLHLLAQESQKQQQLLQNQIQDMQLRLATKHETVEEREIQHEIISLKGELERMKCNTAESLDNTMLKMQLENTKINAESSAKDVEKAKEEYQTMKKIASDRKHRIQELEEKLRSLKLRAQAWKLDDRALHEELDVMKNLVDVKEKQSNTIQMELQHVLSEKQYAVENASKLQHELEILQQISNERQIQMDSLKLEMQSKEQRIQEKDNTITNLKHGSDTNKKLADTQKRQVESLERAINSAGQTIEQKQAEINSLQKSLKVAKKIVSQKQTKLHHVQENVDGATILAAERQKEIMNLFEDLEKNRLLTSDQHIQIELLQNDVYNAKEVIAKQKEELLTMNKELTEVSEVAVEKQSRSENLKLELEAMKKLSDECKNEITELQNKLENITSVSKERELKVVKLDTLVTEQKKENAGLHNQLEQLKEQLRDINRDIKECNEQLNQKSAALMEEESKNKSLNEKIRNLSTDVSEKTRHIDHLTQNMKISTQLSDERLAELKSLQLEIKQLLSENKEYDKMSIKLKHDLESAKNHAENRQRKVEAINGRIEVFKRLADERSDQVQALQKDLKDSLTLATNKQTQIDSMQAVIINQTSELKDLNDKVSKFATENTNSMKKIQDLSEDLKQKTKELSTLQDINQTLFYDKCKSESEKSELNDALIAAKHVLESEKETNKATLHANQLQIVQSREKIQAAENEQKRLSLAMDEMKDHLTTDLNKANKKAEKLSNKLFECESELASLIRHHDAVTTSLKSERKDNGTLKEQCKRGEDSINGLRETVKDLTIEVEKSKIALQTSEDRIVMLTKEKDNLIIDFHSMSDRIKEKELMIQDIYDKNQQNIVTMTHEFTHEKDQLDREKRELQLELNEHKEQCEMLQSQINQRNTQLLSFGKTLRDLENAKKVVKEQESRISQLNKELKETNSYLTDLNASVCDKDNKLDKMDKSFEKSHRLATTLKDQLKQQRETAAKSIREREQEKIALNATLADMEHSLHATTRDLEGVTMTKKALEDNNKELMIMVNKLQDDLSSERQSREESELTVKEQIRSIENYKRAEAMLQEDLCQLRDSVESMEIKLSVERKKVDQIRAEREDLKAAIAAMEKRSSELLQKMNQYQNEVTNAKLKMKSKFRNLKEVDDKVIADLQYQMNFLCTEKDKQTDQLNRMTKEIDELREVSSNKSETCRSLKKRFAELECEKKDIAASLKKAEESLKVETTMQEKLNVRNQELEAEIGRMRKSLAKLQEQITVSQYCPNQTPPNNCADQSSSELKSALTELTKQIQKQQTPPKLASQVAYKDKNMLGADKCRFHYFEFIASHGGYNDIPAFDQKKKQALGLLSGTSRSGRTCQPINDHNRRAGFLFAFGMTGATIVDLFYGNSYIKLDVSPEVGVWVTALNVVYIATVYFPFFVCVRYANKLVGSTIAVMFCTYHFIFDTAKRINCRREDANTVKDQHDELLYFSDSVYVKERLKTRRKRSLCCVRVIEESFYETQKKLQDKMKQLIVGIENIKQDKKKKLSESITFIENELEELNKLEEETNSVLHSSDITVLYKKIPLLEEKIETSLDRKALSDNYPEGQFEVMIDVSTIKTDIDAIQIVEIESSTSTDDIDWTNKEGEEVLGLVEGRMNEKGEFWLVRDFDKYPMLSAKLDEMKFSTEIVLGEIDFDPKDLEEGSLCWGLFDEDRSWYRAVIEKLLPDKVCNDTWMLKEIVLGEIDFDPKDLEEGSLCWGLFDEDRSWYRAVIEKLLPDKNSAAVRWLDYVNGSEVKLHDLLPLKEQFRQFPYQGLRCTLFDDLDDEMPRYARWHFADVTTGHLLKCTLKKK
uniref:Leucine-rich repeat-containing protein DDB_G0290503-like n=1 Tax=Saccoglossus kowalevskii TaxID=10224 RepID=A0ABM0LVC8_SACKO